MLFWNEIYLRKGSYVRSCQSFDYRLKKRLRSASHPAATSLRSSRLICKNDIQIIFIWFGDLEGRNHYPVALNHHANAPVIYMQACDATLAFVSDVCFGFISSGTQAKQPYCTSPMLSGIYTTATCCCVALAKQFQPPLSPPPPLQSFRTDPTLCRFVACDWRGQTPLNLCREWGTAG